MAKLIDEMTAEEFDACFDAGGDVGELFEKGFAKQQQAMTGFTLAPTGNTRTIPRNVKEIRMGKRRSSQATWTSPRRNHASTVSYCFVFIGGRDS